MINVTETEDPMSASTASPNPAEPTTNYKRPGWFARKVFGPFLNFLMHLGISVWGSRVLEHTGRRSGKPHRTPVNLLNVGAEEYLVSPRGETEWVRNVRAADGHLVLILGRHRQVRSAVEVPVEAAAPILRAYLRRWKFEVGMFFDGVGPDSTDEEFAAVAARHPVFELR
jgi:deazaflavin-dependent oxidoreductase (nitroreductase family)